MQILLSLTLSGSAMALVLLALRYVFLRRMPSTVYYYAWLLVLLRFALPLPGLVPVEQAARQVSRPIIASRPLPQEEQTVLPITPSMPEGFVPVTAVTSTSEGPAPEGRPTPVQTAAPKGNAVNLRSPALWLCVWAVGTTLNFGLYLASYMFFTVRVRRSLSSSTLDDRRVFRMLPGRKPRLCRCAAFKTPLMFGVIHPLITLPEQVYDEELLTNILRHELMHYRRRDTIYKWFAVAVLSTQWFNPLSYLIRREINRACELSCDEMLLRGMDRASMRSYGETLIQMASAGVLPTGVVATTFSTDKRNLKERLDQIMNYKRSGARVLATVLTLALLLCFGAVAGASPAKADGVIRVSNVDEFLNAIAPDTVIELAPGTYDLSTASSYRGSSTNPFLVWNEVYDDGAELEIRGVQNLTIRGAGKDSTTIAAMPRYANVIKFSGCQDVTIEGLTAGHTTEPGWCMGGVLRFENCDRTTVNACGLYGCGIIGVWARECSDLTVTDCDIYECSYGAVDVDRCRNVRVEGCDIHDHGTREGQGSALHLFSASYGEGFIVYNNRIHNNRAQGLLRLDYCRGALFLSNDVTGNIFDSPVFNFSEYGATVDGCRFEGNIHGWYQGDVYAGDIDGNLLEGAMLGEMVLRDIDPDTASPLASVADPTEVPKGGSVTVNNVDDFLAAIGPDRTIILDGAMFDLSTASNYGSIGTAYYYWQENPDGPGLVIHDVDGLYIQAQNSSSGATTLAAIPRFADVLSFQNCNNLSLFGFTAGHTKEPGVCSGGVLRFQNCHGVRIEKMRLYGCGILGIQTSQCSSFDILRTEIYECSQGGAMFFQTDGINFSDCSIYDVPSPALVFRESGDKLWNGEPINGLSGEYNVMEDGLEALGSQADIDFGNMGIAGEVQIIPLNQDDPEYLYLKDVQRNIVAGEWEVLADRIHYPVSFLLPALDHSTSRIILNSREEFLAQDMDSIFDQDYRKYVASASVSEVYPVWGFTALDGAVCYRLFEETTPMVPKLTIFNITAAHATGEVLSMSYLDNDYNIVPPIPFEEGTPQLDFARVVQKEIADWNWAALASKCSFPLTIYTENGGYVVDNSADFLALVSSPDNPLTPDFCEMIAHAELDSYGGSLFGNTFCAHRLAMSCFADQIRSMDDFKITCINTDKPLYQYVQYAQAVPPTPAPALRVMFYASELRDQFTLYPPDAVELHVEIPTELAGSEVDWASDHPSVLRVEKTGADTALVSCVDDGTLPQTCKLTVSCAGNVREITVNCRK